MKEVSAIITTHNRCKLLARAIESVLSQTYQNIECIVVDDASTDETSDICKKYPIRYIYISKEESHGGNYARNLGIKTSKGKYCAFLDDDDYWLPAKIEKQVNLIEHKNCEMVFCGRRIEYIKGNSVEYKDSLPVSSQWGDMCKKILQTIPTTTTCILVDRQALIDVGMFDENLKFWQEYELTIRLAQRKSFYCVCEPLCIYRVDKTDAQRLTNKYHEWKKAVKYIRKKHHALYNQLSFVEKYKAWNLVWVDALKRCKVSGLKGKYLFYLLLTLPLMIIRRVKKLEK